MEMQMNLVHDIKYENYIVMWGLVLTPLIIIPSKTLVDYFYLPKVLFLTILSFAYLISLVRDKGKLNEMTKIDSVYLCLYLYAIYLGISVFFADNHLMALKGRIFREEGYATIVMYILLFLAARASKYTHKKLLNYVLYSAIIISCYGIMQYLGWDPIPRDFMRLNYKAAFSTIGNPNFLGSYLVLIIPVAIHNYMSDEKHLGLISYSLLFLCLLCTRTRGAWLGGIACIFCYSVIYIYTQRFKIIRTKKILHLFIATLIAISIFSIITPEILGVEFLSIFTDAYDVAKGTADIEKAGTWRFFIWKRVVELIKVKPWFGHGIEHLDIVFDSYYHEDVKNIIGRKIYFDRAHNEYLHIAVSSGIPALLLYLSFVYLSLKKGFKRIQSDKLFLVPFMAAVCGYLVQAFFNISVVSVAYIYWIFLGILVSGEFEETNKNELS